MDFGYVYNETLTFEICLEVKVMAHPWAMDNNCRFLVMHAVSARDMYKRGNFELKEKKNDVCMSVTRMVYYPHCEIARFSLKRL